MAREKLFLIDGSAIFYRSYFAFIRNPLINSKGENTSTTFGFLNTIFKIIEDEKPEYFSIIFDTKEPTFRHNIYQEYKATRERMPDEMAATFPRLIQALQTLKMNIFEKDGYEADDIIATIARRYASKNLHTLIVSGDKDLAQIVNENINIYIPTKSSSQSVHILDMEGVKEKYGVYPEQIIDWLALMGDKSDNIPGIPSVGEKTACNLINQFQSIELMYENIDEITKEALRERIREHRDQTELSIKLVTLEDNVPLDVSLENLKLKTWDKNKLDVLLKDMEFSRLLVQAANILELIEGKGYKTPGKKIANNVDYRIINNEEDLELLLKKWKTVDEFVFDLETDSLDTFSAEIAGIALSFKPDQAYYIALNHPDAQLQADKILRSIQPYFENTKIKKIGQNIKFDTMILRQHGINVNNLFFDTMIASFLINSTSSQHNLDNLAMDYLEYKMIPIEDIIGSGKNQKKMTELPCNDVFQYACEDADVTLKLMYKLQPKLKELKLEDLFYSIEMPLVAVLIEMEEHGVTLDTKLLQSLSKDLAGNLIRLQKAIYDHAGEEFNINSPQQLGRILFDKLEIHKQINMRKPKRTKTGQYATSEQILERYYRHQLPKEILEYRKLNKLKNTYVDALPNLIKSNTGRVHTSYNQTVAATGRLSSVNPNLQNIPIRTEIGRQMRKAFTTSQQGALIMSADYSQIELRIMAHLSGDEKMKESFINDLDIHAATASQIFNIPLTEISEDHRRKAKEINFGIIYGMSKYGLSNRLEISVEEAEQFIYEYFATFPKIQDYMRDTIAAATRNGYVTTMRGRIRYMPQIQSSNRQLREFAERTSINTPIQGSAADLIKMAMININRALSDKGLTSRMILQVHDELVFEVPEDELDVLRKMVKIKMENAIELTVPIKVEIGVGNNWLEAH
jgi:DNA polymerase-1